MKKTAVLIDIGFALPKLREKLGRFPKAKEVHDFAQACLIDGEELFRIYCYHCLPYEDEHKHPISGVTMKYRDSPQTPTLYQL
jgi:hypothetical protein